MADFNTTLELLDQSAKGTKKRSTREKIEDSLDEVSQILYGKPFKLCLGAPAEIVCEKGTVIRVDIEKMTRRLKRIPKGTPYQTANPYEFTPLIWLKSMLYHAEKNGMVIKDKSHRWETCSSWGFTRPL